MAWYWVPYSDKYGEAGICKTKTEAQREARKLRTRYTDHKIVVHEVKMSKKEYKSLGE